jgi:hypothetical protein
MTVPVEGEAGAETAALAPGEADRMGGAEGGIGATEQPPRRMTAAGIKRWRRITAV